MNALSSFLARHDALLLFFCSLLFGIAFGLGYERGLVPVPPWYTGSLHRFCILLMGWTALMHADPLQKLIWSVTDFVALTLHFFAGSMFVPSLPLPDLINYWVSLGKIAAAASFGIAITQGVYSLLPGWRDAFVKRLPVKQAIPLSTPAPIVEPAPEETAEVQPPQPQILYRHRPPDVASMRDTHFPITDAECKPLCP